MAAGASTDGKISDEINEGEIFPAVNAKEGIS
jgi:hypothetical protein